MSSANVPPICWFNGTLTVDRNNKKYINMIVKPVTVRKSIIRRELVEKIHRITKINPNEEQIHLICIWLIAQRHFTAMPISDDEDTQANA